MKKILFIFFLIIVYILIIEYKMDDTYVSKIDLNLKEKEMGITFINLEDSKSLLINKEDIFILVILEYLNDNKINEVLKMFGIEKLDYVLMNDEYNMDILVSNKVINKKKFKVKDISFFNNDNELKINYLDHNFCVYEKIQEESDKDCKYIYFLTVDKKIEVDEEVNMVFYDEDTNPDYLESLYNQWIDIYMIKKEYFVTLKLDEDNYDTITLPLNN